MNNMTQEFIKYQQALALKELGFDEECLGFYERDQKFIIQECEITDFHSNSLQCVAPTFSQAFRWFREKYGLYCELFVDDGKTFGFMISYFTTEGRIDKPIQRDYVTYEETEQACLEKLIEIVKNK